MNVIKHMKFDIWPSYLFLYVLLKIFSTHTSTLELVVWLCIVLSTDFSIYHVPMHHFTKSNSFVTVAIVNLLVSISYIA